VLTLGACATIYLLALGAIALGQRKLMYFPYAREAAPASIGLPQAEVLHLRTDDGETLLGWLIAPAPGRPLILYFHGNANGLGQLGPRFRQLTATGAGVLGVEYRGYAGSTGSPSEDGLLRDGEAAYAEAMTRGFAPARIVAMGESLGTGVAVDLASRHRVGAVVLDAPYSATVDVAEWRFPIFPVRWLMRDQFRSNQKIGKISAPLLIIHGTADRTIPIRFGEKLFALANEPRKFIRLDGVGHPALESAFPEVLQWIDETMARVTL
jgi:fermentation-respiration switch protein FrsA (DUF1100 family)